MSRLAAESLTIRRGGHAIVDAVTAAFEPGMFVALGLGIFYVGWFPK